MRIVLSQTQTTLIIDMPDRRRDTGAPSMPVRPPGPADGRHARAENPLFGLGDLLGKLRTETASGRDSKLWTLPTELFNECNGTSLT